MSAHFRAWLAPLVVCALVAPAWPRAARANPCASAYSGLPMGPVPLSFLAGGLGTPYRACPRTEVVIGGGGQAIYEPDNFYGNIQAGALVAGSFALTPELELFGSLEPLYYQTVISSFAADHLGVGHSAIGATVQIHAEGPLVLAAGARTTLPTAFGLYKNAFPVGLDASFLASLQLASFFRLHAQAGALGSVAVTAGDPGPRAGLLALLGGEVLLWDRAALVGDISSLSLYNAELDYLAASLGLRVRIFAGLGAEAGVLIPLAGRERSLAAGMLRVSYRFDD